MTDLLLSLFNINEQQDYSFIIPVVLVYIVLFWVVVSIWVLYDAKKRFQSKKIAALICVGNLLFQLPFLLLYLLFRPMEEEYFENSQGGVNVPIVNFTGEEGVVMSLELHINNHKMMPQNASEMKIDVNFESQDKAKQLIEASVEAVEQAEVATEKFVTRLSRKLKNIFLAKPKTAQQVNAIANDESSAAVQSQASDVIKKKKKKKKKK